MSSEKEIRGQIAFAEMTVELGNNFRKLCGEAYKPTKKGAPKPKNLDDLIHRAEAQLAEYEDLLERYSSGGERDAILQVADYAERLTGYTKKLKKLAKS